MAGGPVFVEYRQANEVVEYRVVEVEGCDFGRGFEVVKLTGDDCFKSYDVNIDTAPGLSTCECWGFLRYEQRGPCRHILLLQQLAKDGHLPIRPRPRPMPPRPPRPAACCEDGSCLACTDIAEDRQRRLADLSLDDL
jgi:hypothetical protein